MKMKILSITAQKPDSTGSGVYLTELVRGFAKEGIDQAVIVGIGKTDTVNLPEEVRVFPVHFETDELPFPVVGMSDEMPYRSTRYSEMTEEMTAQFAETFRRRLAEAVAEFQPDVILCHHLYFLAALVCEACKSKKRNCEADSGIVCAGNGGDGDSAPQRICVYGISHGSDLRQFKKNPWQREFIAKWIPGLDGIFALHEEQKAEICTLFGCGKEKVRVIGTGYNSDVFFIEENRKEERCGKCADGSDDVAKVDDADRTADLRLIFAGKISEKKGVKSLIRAMDFLGASVHLTLAGGAGNEQEYKEICELAEKSPCRIEFTGRMAQKELAERMNQNDIFILPSFYEGLPLVMVEAMACGLHVVCTDLPGIQPWLNANIPANGVVFVEPPEMVNEDEPVEESLPAFERRLAEAVRVAAKAELPRREDVERISWDGLCGRLSEMLRRIAGERIF